jgi:hypothetical protein
MLSSTHLHEQGNGIADFAAQQRALLVDDERLTCKGGMIQYV